MSISSREVIKKLADDGWVEVAQSGSHKQFKHPDMKIGTIKSIEKQSGVKLR